MEWFFNGLGSQIVTIIITMLISGSIGGMIGYKIGIKKSIRQYQKAGDNSKQEQLFDSIDRIDNHVKESTNHKKHAKLSQIQKAGNDSTQSQIGEINDVWK